MDASYTGFSIVSRELFDDSVGRLKTRVEELGASQKAMQRKDPHGAGPCQTQQTVLTDRKTDDALVVFQITVSLQCEIWTGGRRRTFESQPKVALSGCVCQSGWEEGILSGWVPVQREYVYGYHRW